MPPVEQRPSPSGNPGASLYVRRRRRHPERRAGASAAIARHAGRGHGASAGSDWRPRVGQRRAPGASRRGCNTDCRDRSGCTRRPGCGTRRTGTDGLEGPTTPPDRAGSAGRSRPSAPHCCGTAFIGTVSGTARSSGFPAREGRRRAHLLQLGSGCTPPTATPSRPVWPPCRAARQAPLIDQLLGSQYRELLPHEGCKPNPLPRHHICAVPDQRSQLMN